jgi:hypothetical protein
MLASGTGNAYSATSVLWARVSNGLPSKADVVDGWQDVAIGTEADMTELDNPVAGTATNQSLLPAFP